MANWNGFVLTHVGAELQAKVNAGLTDLVFTKVALGDGTATGDLQNLTDLVSRKKDLTISDISVNANVVIVKSIITNENLQTGFYMREMGLYATDPDDGEILYAVMLDTNPDYMPADGSATVVSELLTLNLTMSNTGNVSATLDASQLIHRSEFFGLLIEKLASALPMTISSLNTNSVFYRLLQYALNAAGVQYNFTNSSAWYICLGALFGGLIIQGGKSKAELQIEANSASTAEISIPLTANTLVGFAGDYIGSYPMSYRIASNTVNVRNPYDNQRNVTAYIQWIAFCMPA